MNYTAEHVYEYDLGSRNIDVDRIMNELARHGVTDIRVKRSPNFNTISVKLVNPNPDQIRAVESVLGPFQQQFARVFSQTLSPLRNLFVPLEISSREPSRPRIQELPQEELLTMPRSVSPQLTRTPVELPPVPSAEVPFISSLPLTRASELPLLRSQPPTELPVMTRQGYISPELTAIPSQGYVSQLTRPAELPAVPSQEYVSQLTRPAELSAMTAREYPSPLLTEQSNFPTVSSREYASPMTRLTPYSSQRGQVSSLGRYGMSMPQTEGPDIEFVQ